MDFLFNHSFDEKQNVWRVEISGEVDIFNSPGLKNDLIDLLNQKQCDMYIDCQHLEYIDSTGLGCLVAALKTARAYKGNIHLLQLKPNISKLFKITEMDKVFILEGGHHE